MGRVLARPRLHEAGQAQVEDGREGRVRVAGEPVVLGLALLSIAVIGPRTPWGYVGLVPLATGIFGFCPLYRLVGVNTCKVKAK